MSIVFFLLGGVVLAYWGYGMSQPQWNRPRVIIEKGGVLLATGLALIAVGFMV